MAPSLKLVQQFVALPALSPSMWPDGSGGVLFYFPTWWSVHPMISPDLS